MQARPRRTPPPAPFSRPLAERLEPRLLLDAGLAAQYFDEVDLTALADTGIDGPIDVTTPSPWDDAPANTAVEPDKFYSVRWTGFVHAPQGGDWTYYTNSNDGVRLYVEGNLLHEDWTNHTPTEHSTQVTLPAGWHPIVLEYYQHDGTSTIQLSFEGPGQGKAIIPLSHLSTVDLDGADPVADAGEDRTLVLPDSAVTLHGTARDDGQITGWQWTKLSGPAATTTGTDTPDLALADLVEGTYVFRLTVTDDDANTASDDVQVFVVPDTGGQAAVTGELRTWHKVTLTWDGPATSETAQPNPFTDYRLNVTFTGPGGQTFLVPGYYAADGDAANTHATAGTKWRAHFAPDEVGEWTYAASFRTGTNVAVEDSPTAGSGAGYFDGDAGTFTVAETDKTGRDLRGKGLLEYVGGHYLRFAGTGEYFLKQGPDAPENLLAYEDFDGPFKSDGRNDNYVKDYQPHVADWVAGDPTWDSEQDGDATADDGKGLIGAINYLAGEGLNAFSFLPMNIGGDDRNVFPYLDYNERYRMDCSRLDQWEIVLEHGTREGFFLHFKTQERENQDLLDGGDLGLQRTLYYRELIARFAHHLALNWNLGEETDTPRSTTAQKQAWADYFWDHDPYRHHVVIHNGSDHYDLLGPYDEAAGTGSQLTGFSLQTSSSSFTHVHSKVKDYLARSADAGKPWAVACDEPGDASHALRPDDDAGSSHEDGRKNALWGTLLAGGWGNEWYFGYQHDHSDLTLNDFRSRDDWWDYCRYALEFFADHDVPFWRMANDNGISSSADDYGFYEAGETYVVYLKNGGTTDLDLRGETGTFSVRWYDPRNGGALREGTVAEVAGGDWRSLGQPPETTGEDWLCLVERAGGILFVRGGTGTVGFLEGGSDDQAADITDTSTAGGNHGWYELAELLRDEGYVLTQLQEGPAGNNTPIDFASMDLGQYDVIVLGSNNADYTDAQVDAVEDWVHDGGGLLVISDANFGSDWADASNSDQEFLDRFGLIMNQDHGTYSLYRSQGDFLVPDHPILDGVDRFDGEGVTPITLGTPVPGVTARVVVRAGSTLRQNNGSGGNNQGSLRSTTDDDGALVTAEAGDGRLAGHFDRNTFFNLNGAGTNINRFDNATYARNLFNWLARRTTDPEPEPLREPDTPEAIADGLEYAYYNGTWDNLPDFDALTPVAEGTAGTIDLAPATDEDYFGLVFTGFLQAPADGTYTLYTNSDDGSRMFVGDQLVVDNDATHAPRERSGQIGLAAGLHAIRVEFFEKDGGQVLDVLYSGPGVTKQELPAGALFREIDPPPTVEHVEINAGLGRYDELLSVAVRFSEDVSASLDAGDMIVRDAATGQTAAAPEAVAWDGGTRTGTWTFAAADVPTGWYQTVISARRVYDPTGNRLDGDGDGTGGDPHVHTFAVVPPGDADGDGTVGRGDLSAIRANLGAAGGASWVDGDVTGDERVTYADYIRWKRHVGETVSPAPPAASPAASPATSPATSTAQTVQISSTASTAPLAGSEPADALAGASVSPAVAPLRLAASTPTVQSIRRPAAPDEAAEPAIGGEDHDKAPPPPAAPAADTRPTGPNTTETAIIPDATILAIAQPVRSPLNRFAQVPLKNP